MIAAQNDFVMIQLGLKETEYLDAAKNSLTEEEYKKFVNIYNSCSNSQQEVIRTIIPKTLVDDNKDSISFLFAVQAIDTAKLEQTVNVFKEKYKDN